MKKVVLLIAAVASLMLANASHAQIGKPLSVFEQWYGKGTGQKVASGESSDPTETAYRFRGGFGPYNVFAVFKNGVAEFVSYSYELPDGSLMPDKNSPGGYKSVQPREVKSLLANNSNGYVWTKSATFYHHGQPWEDDYSAHLDGKIAYRAWYAKGKLDIATKAYADAHGM